jgi:hypothetical protein
MKTTRAVLTRMKHEPRFKWGTRCRNCGRRWPCPSAQFHRVLADLDAQWLLTLLIWSDGALPDLDFERQPVPARFQQLLQHAVQGVEAQRRGAEPAPEPIVIEDPRVPELLTRCDRVRRVLYEAHNATDSRGRRINMVGIRRVEKALDGDL